MIDMSTHHLKIEQRRIQRLIDLCDKTGISARLGSLYKDARGDASYYYERFYGPSGAVKNYLGTRDSEALRAHCSRKYRRELICRLEKNLSLLRKLEDNYMRFDNAAIMGSLPSTYSKLSASMFIDERYEELSAWAGSDYPVNSIPFPDSINVAQDGTRVRSKGEEIIYNMLLSMGIPFRYDCVLTFHDENGNTRSFSPDFLIQCYDGTFIIIEHLGRMDDIKYSHDFGYKCCWYFQQGFILGKNFFVTSDEPSGGTDSEAIAKIISLVERAFWGY